MSPYNIKLKIWSRESDVRIYCDGRFVDYNCEWSGAESVYLTADENGNVKWRHGFQTGPGTIRRAENNAYAAMAIIKDMGFDKITFAEVIERINGCLTPKGNFSYRKYEAKYLL